MPERVRTALLFLALLVPCAAAQDDPPEEPAPEVTHVERTVEDQEHMRYRRLFWKSPAVEAPQDGEPVPANKGEDDTQHKLLVILPGGGGGPDFTPWCETILRSVLGEGWEAVQLIAPVWDEKQPDQNVWPTKGLKYPGMKFTTEEFIAAVIDEQLRADPEHIYVLGWSSSGQAVYSYSLTKGSRATGSFVAMSIYKPDLLPKLKAAKGHAYYLLHSPEDFIPMRFPEAARDELTKAKAKVQLTEYAGGHGWHDNPIGRLRTGIEWLMENRAKAAPVPKRKRRR